MRGLCMIQLFFTLSRQHREHYVRKWRVTAANQCGLDVSTSIGYIWALVHIVADWQLGTYLVPATAGPV